MVSKMTSTILQLRRLEAVLLRSIYVPFSVEGIEDILPTGVLPPRHTIGRLVAPSSRDPFFALLVGSWMLVPQVKSGRDAIVGKEAAPGNPVAAKPWSLGPRANPLAD
jgi:hypothetical protein